MRNADALLPLMLGDLRQEIHAEQVLLRQRVQDGDNYGIFPQSRRRRSRRKYHEASQLLEKNLNSLWQQFKNVERPFLIRDPVRAERFKGVIIGASVMSITRLTPDRVPTRNRSPIEWERPKLDYLLTNKDITGRT